VDWELNDRLRTQRGEIAYRSLGEGPPVVLVHGTPSRSLVWRQVAPVLARRHRVIAWDLLGFGDSERHVEQDVSLVAHGEVLAELVEQLELDRPAFVGHDIGGAVALRAHLVEAVPISRLALVDAVVLAPWITPRTRAMQQDLERWGQLPDPELARTIEAHLRSATAGRLAPDVFAALFGQWEGERGQALYLRNLAQFDERHTIEFEGRLPAIEAPTLVVWGEQDAWLPVETSERIAALIPGAERMVIPAAGHFSMEDAPDQVAAALDAFLA
jgi:pimeloyl-ACP methyl ester carboxylesterase